MYKEHGIKPIIFIDSCICLRIVKVVDYGKQATNVELQKILSLKKYISEHDIEINPFFGLLELCFKGDKANEEKYWDFKNRISFFKELPLKRFVNFSYKYERDYFIFRRPSLNLHGQALHLDLAVLYSYCCLLKIRLLAKKGLTKSHAFENIKAFFNWMKDDLDMGMGAEYKLALSILGGQTKFRKMIALDSKTSDIRKILMATAWDLFNAKNASNSFRFFKLFGENVYPIFMTNDNNLFELFRGSSLTFIKDGGKHLESSFLHNSEFEYPHLDEQFIQWNNENHLEALIDRRNKPPKIMDETILPFVQILESANGVI